MTQLSAAQKRVMKWLGYGWSAQRSHGTTFEVNGQRICNLDTMTSLKKKGLIVETKTGTWEATEEGKSLTGRLCL